MRNLIILILLFITSFILEAQEKQDTTANIVELSFGQSIQFISNSKQLDIRNQEALIVPTNSILFLATLRPDKKLHIPVFFNLATESKQFIVNGQLVNEKASPTFGFGLEYRLLRFRLQEKTHFEFSTGTLFSLLFTKNDDLRIGPIIAGRIRLLRGEHFSMYIGGSYSIGINSAGLFYGTGTSF